MYLELLLQWRDIAHANRSKRNVRILTEICSIDSLYRSGLRQLRLNMERQHRARERNTFQQWKSLFNTSMNERVLYHRIRVIRRARCFISWKEEVLELLETQLARVHQSFKAWQQVLYINQQELFACDHYCAVSRVKVLYAWKFWLRKMHAQKIRPIFHFMNVHMRQSISCRRLAFESWLLVAQKRPERKIQTLGEYFSLQLKFRTERLVLATFLETLLIRKRIQVKTQTLILQRNLNRWSLISHKERIMKQMSNSAIATIANMQLASAFTKLVLLHLAHVWHREVLQGKCLSHFKIYFQQRTKKEKLALFARTFYNRLTLKRYFKAFRCALRIRAQRYIYTAHGNMKEDLMTKRKAMISWKQHNLIVAKGG